MPDGFSSHSPIHGAGGLGGGGSSGGREAENTLRARNILRVLYLISEGPIAGWQTDEARKSIFLTENQTPIIAADGSTNFEMVDVQWRLGDAGASYIEGFPSAEDTFAGPGRVTADNTPQIRTVDLTSRDRLKVGIQLPAMYHQDDKGNVDPTSVSLRIEWRPSSGGPWQSLQSDTISGKCVSPYSKVYSWAKPYNGIIDIRVVRETPDPADTKTGNLIDWVSYSAVLDQKMLYPGCAYVALAFDAEKFNGQIPQVTFAPLGLYCDVPTNYDAETRTYSGLWNGTFKQAWTRNPAWIFWTLATNPRWGAGRALAAGLVNPTAAYQAAASLVDRWTLYSIAQYCDETVPDGFGGMEPRYQTDLWINSDDEAYRVLQSIASSFRAMIYWGGGKIVPVADRPSEPKKLVTRSNIIGDFLYEGASQRSQHSLVRVRWRDPVTGYREAVELVDDPELMRAVGYRPIDYEAVGCTSRSQARRMGRWILFTEKYEDRMVRWTASRDHANVVPGDIVLIQDSKLAGLQLSGRLACTPTSNSQLQLDRSVTFEAGKTYSFAVVLPSGDLSALTPLTNGPGTTDLVLLQTPLGQVPIAEAVWVITASDLAPVHYRVLHVKEDAEEGTYEISAARHYPGKYDMIEQGLALEDTPFSIERDPYRAVPVPTNLQVEEYVGGQANTALLRVIFSWTSVQDTWVTGYEAEAIREGALQAAQLVAGATVEFADLQPGNYTFRVRSLGRQGATSAWAYIDAVNVDGRADPPAPPTGLTAEGGIRANVIRWNSAASRHLRGTQVWASSNATFSAGGQVGEAPFGSFIHSGLLPNQTWFYWIRSVDTFGQTSGWVGPVQATTSLLVAADLTQGIIDTAAFAAGIAPVMLIDDLTASAANDTVAFNKADGQLYRRNGGTWVNSVPAVAITGSLSSDQIEGLDAAKLAGEIGETQISDGAISTPKLAAGAVTAANLAAGSVTTSALAVGSSNVIWNSCSTLTIDGWSVYGESGLVAALTSPAKLSWPAYDLAGHGAAGTYISGAPNGPKLFVQWDQEMAVAADQRVQVSALVITHRSEGASLEVMWLDISGNLLASSVTSVLANTTFEGRSLANWQRIGGIFTAPSGATGARLRLRLHTDGGTDPYLFWTQAMLAPAPANATELGTWTPGGVTAISGGQILAATIQAAALAAGSVTTDKLAANSIVAGKIAAGAISATEIAANAINATHLAATTLITATAQIGDLTVSTLKVVGEGVTSNSYTEQTPSVSVSRGTPYNHTQIADLWVDVAADGRVLIFASAGAAFIADSGGGGGDGGGGSE
ncbi:host specificity protein J [Rhodovarius crocodyli]|uniref:Host specificity protein J n=1 Tax=Rhodovarius crocodyli TaxID=1979269 RepID=A0A437MF57_9PROT|nr:phage tail protein [Rhodovarius crocodyli]RVT96255.1 host specificity protein J [Rhodovarius crocodyli]